MLIYSFNGLGYPQYTFFFYIVVIFLHYLTIYAELLPLQNLFICCCKNIGFFLFHVDAEKLHSAMTMAENIMDSISNGEAQVGEHLVGSISFLLSIGIHSDFIKLLSLHRVQVNGFFITATLLPLRAD